MKLGILTQSMGANYGCNLQAFALQSILEQMGHYVEILDRWNARPNTNMPTPAQRIIMTLKEFIKVLLNKPIYRSIKYSDRSFFWSNFLNFQRKYLNLTQPFYTTEELRDYIENVHFDGFVVGSDQVWRPDYNKNGMLENMFLDITGNEAVKRVAYAASFGVDIWTFTDEQTEHCRKLAQRFDGISVREESGVRLCQDYLNVSAEHVLDPTLLLDSGAYNSLLTKTETYNSNGDMYCYILDYSAVAKSTVKYIQHCTGMKPYTCLPLIPEGTYCPFHKPDAVLPSVEQWLRSFKDAKMVLVDSFHGMVFSIIYNKPFWVLLNPKRGSARFQSLLSLLGLEDRILSYERLKNVNLNECIDWRTVNELLLFQKNKSLAFLNRYLNNKIK